MKKILKLLRMALAISGCALLLTVALPHAGAGAGAGARASSMTTRLHIALPESVTPFEIGTESEVNGLRVRMIGFTSEAKPAEVRQHFREALAGPSVENRLGNKTVIGRLSGRYYITVQIEAAGAGTRGVVAQTDLKAMRKAHSLNKAATERWLSRFPAGSAVTTRMTSNDGSKPSEHLVIINNHGVQLNSDALKEILLEEGYLLQRETGAPDHSDKVETSALPDAKMLFFKSRTQEATAVVSRDPQGRTAVVLNIVSLMQASK